MLACLNVLLHLLHLANEILLRLVTLPERHFHSTRQSQPVRPQAQGKRDAPLLQGEFYDKCTVDATRRELTLVRGVRSVTCSSNSLRFSLKNQNSHCSVKRRYSPASAVLYSLEVSDLNLTLTNRSPFVGDQFSHLFFAARFSHECVILPTKRINSRRIHRADLSLKDRPPLIPV